MQIKFLLLTLLGAVCRSDITLDLRVGALFNGGTKLKNTCDSTVNRLRKELPDYTSIIAAGEEYTDTDFYRKE